jgi:anti-sigma-K factor RskA
MDEDHDRIAARYVLGLARGNERALIERRLEHDPELKTRIERWERRFLTLDLAIDSSAAPPDLSDSLINDIEAACVASPETTTIRTATNRRASRRARQKSP